VTNHQIFGPTSNYVEKTKSLIWYKSEHTKESFCSGDF
jgi:hypothetical protein